MKTIEEVEALRESYISMYESADEADRLIIGDRITVLDWVLGDMA